MKLEQVKCPVCGGAVDVDDNFETAKCPFCKSSFVIEDVKITKKAKEPAVYDTKVIDVDPDFVQNELDIYSFFGWDFKHRKTHKVYDGRRKFKNGNYHDQYKDVVQITLQRNVKAVWCTHELMEKEKRFFELREKLQHTQSDIPYSSFNRYEKESLKPIEILQIAIFPIVGLILSIIFFTNGSRLNDEKNYVPALILLLLALPCFAGGVVGGILFGVKNVKKAKKRHEDKEEAARQQDIAREENLKAKQEPLEREMLEIINWAGEHMEAKFGYKLAGKID